MVSNGASTCMKKVPKVGGLIRDITCKLKSHLLNHNCFILRMRCKAVGPVCCVMHVKEPRTLIVKEKGLAPVFLDLRLEPPVGWICAR